MNFFEEWKKRTGHAEEVIRRYLPAEEGFAVDLAAAMNYSMTAGGKRIRPVLLQEAYSLYGGTGAEAEPFMAALEMIHTHSLIHDDLPAIDNDGIRRGRPTLHVLHGEALAVLAGDALLNYAYETALSAFDFTQDPARTARAIRILAGKTGIHGMLGGQSVDVRNEKQGTLQFDEDTLRYIYLNKTAALLEAPLMIGACLAGADDPTLEILRMTWSGIKILLAIVPSTDAEGLESDDTQTRADS